MRHLANCAALAALTLYVTGWLAMCVVGPLFLVYQLLRLLKEVL